MNRLNFFPVLFVFSQSLLIANPKIEDCSLFPEQIASVEADKDNLILGVISPISGQLSLRSQDLVSKGVEDLTLNRTYVSPYLPVNFNNEEHFRKDHEKRSLAKFFYYNHVGWQLHGNLEMVFDPYTKTLYLKDKSGASIPFKREQNHLKFEAPSYGISNLGSNGPHRYNDPRHIQGEFIENSAGLIITFPDGTIKYYQRVLICLENPSLVRYYLVKETLPSGRQLAYHRTKEGMNIQSYNPKATLVYTKLFKTQNSDHFKVWKTKENKEARFSYLNAFIKGTVKKKNYKEKFVQPIQNLLNQASTPFNRRETVNYTPQYLIQSIDNRDYQFQVSYKPFGDPAYWRISDICFPTNDQFIKVTLDYIPAIAGQSCGITTVYFEDGSFIKYHISEQLLLNAIQYCDQTGRIVKQKCFKWLPNNYIESISMFDDNQRCLFETCYQYDELGNATKETLIGDLQGHGTKDAYSISKTYSNDRFANLIQENHDNGKVISYSYLPNTNLITSKITANSEKIFLREFFIYDHDHNLILEISDDGSQIDPYSLEDVAVRKLKKYKLRQSDPFLHMPEAIEYSALINHKETLLSSKKLKYDIFGNLEQEEVFDAKGRFLYTTFKTYNERGDVLTTQNPLGHIHYYDYDQKGRCIFSKNTSGRLATSLNYDAKGRLISRSEIGDETLKQETFYAYDTKDRVIKYLDHLGNCKSYNYHSFLENPSQECLPELETFSGQSQEVLKTFEYDALGNKLVAVDPLGNKTIYAYNARNQVTHIQHPSGATEKFGYYLDGSLAYSITEEGLKKNYKYDILGNLLQTDYISAQGQYLASEYSEYKADRLVSFTTKEGKTTSFIYDGAGRKIKEDCEGRIKEYVYNDLNQLIKVIIHNSKNTLVTHYQKDFLDQLLSEEKTDLKGHCFCKKSYSYDADGNIIEKTLFINDKKSLWINSFDPFKRCLNQTDPKGNQTNFIYDDHQKNNLGQRCLTVTETNPKGVKTISVYNPYNKLTLRQTINPLNQVIACSKNIYDSGLNLSYHIDELYANSCYLNSQTVKNTYNSMNLLATSVRGYCTKDQKITFYDYTPSGKLLSKKLPSGCYLNYVYDDLGYLKTLQSSDGQINHSFTYSLEGNLLEAHDHISQCGFTRTLNQFAEVEKETFSTGITIERSFDSIGRVIYIKFDKYGEVFYNYDPLNLKKITRITPQKQTYCHNFDDYDLSGRCLKETLPHSLGSIAKTYDVTGCLSKFKSSYLKQKYYYDASYNLILKETENKNISFDYDNQEQLIQEGDQYYSYDSLYNRQGSQLNSLNELSNLAYDALGNLTKHNLYTMRYDSLNRLIQAESDNKLVTFSYDPLGRCLTRSLTDKINYFFSESDTEHYLFDSYEEIGSISLSQGLKDLKIMTPFQETIAFEVNHKLYSALTDPFGNVQKIIDIRNPKISYSYDCGAFGEHLKENSPPWVYKGKRFDKDLQLVNFGSRFYDPNTGRWCSIDPQGFEDSYNLYQYVFNNPYKYKDPNGEFIIALPLLVWGAELILPTISALAVKTVYAGAAVAIAYAGYKYTEMLHDRTLAAQSHNDYVLYSEAEDENKKNKAEPRTEPKDLSEQLALEEAKAKPSNPADEIMKGQIRDPRYPANSWKKVDHIHEKPDGSKIDIHYWEHRVSGEKQEFKFKNR